MADHDRDRQPELTDKPRKRKIHGSKKEKMKFQRLSGHSIGEDCRCTRYQCFNSVNQAERQQLVDKFNECPNKNAQDAYLSTLVKLRSVARRRPRAEENASLRAHSVQYTVKVQRPGQQVKEVQVCQKAFCSIFGITKNRVETIRKALSTIGHPPKDGRGQHKNRPHKLKDETKKAIQDHISSFRGRSSHYAMAQTRRLYLPEDLNVSKMFDMFNKLHPDATVKYETYRKLFNSDFNIGFGYPRKDTCPTCDEFRVNLEHNSQQILHADGDNLLHLTQQREELMIQKEIHVRKANTFYSRKADAKTRAKANPEFEAIAFDYQKNLPLPNKTANDVYYKRQLTFFTFCIHVLSTDEVYFYTYDETIAKKGADDVCSMLNNFVQNYLPDTVTEISFFCDVCPGQNKNFTVFRFFNYLVHDLKRLHAVKCLFPIRGHSYMECDRDMGNINSKADVELPQEWRDVFLSARKKPSPFNVIAMGQDSFFAFTTFLKGNFRGACPVPTRPIRELKFENANPQVIKFRNNWNGPFESAVFRKPIPRARGRRAEPVLARSYTELLPIKKAKYDDLQVLKKLCKPSNHAFFDNLPAVGIQASSSSDSELSDED